MASPPFAAPAIRCRQLNDSPPVESADFILYIMRAFRRTGWNFALQKSVSLAQDLNKPLLIVEPLSCSMPCANDRLHRFTLDGMADNTRRMKSRSACYYPFVERQTGEAQKLLSRLAQKACVVVTDDFPDYSATAQQFQNIQPQVATIAVDSNGLMPLNAIPQAYPSAYAFRRFLQKYLPAHLGHLPHPDPLKDASLPMLRDQTLHDLTEGFSPSFDLIGERDTSVLSSLPIDHSIAPAPCTGGTTAARRRLTRFLDHRLEKYAEYRNHPDLDVTSGLSPYLHSGHISSHEIFFRLAEMQQWSPDRLSPETRGRREGWWGMSQAAEAFLDQLVTWRELGYAFAFLREDAARYESLPDWVRQSLESHEQDPRPWLYPLADFEQARTHDPLWNAAQQQLRREGIIQNYLRMLWGKKILEWSPGPRQALSVMLELNDRYALDGCNPNSLSGIFWCLGRFDRPWPERPIYGRVRSMSSDNTARKVSVEKYLNRFGDRGEKK
jgi:deoxyribodipyrimidine photo-lyase